MTPDYEKLKEIALFLVGPASIPDPAYALGLYISVGGQEWQYRGYVSVDHPSEVRPRALLTCVLESSIVLNSRSRFVLQVMPLQWPVQGPLHVGPGTIQLGVCLEPLGMPRARHMPKPLGVSFVVGRPLVLKAQQFQSALFVCS